MIRCHPYGPSLPFSKSSFSCVVYLCCPPLPPFVCDLLPPLCSLGSCLRPHCRFPQPIPFVNGVSLLPLSPTPRLFSLLTKVQLPALTFSAPARKDYHSPPLSSLVKFLLCLKFLAFFNLSLPTSPTLNLQDSFSPASCTPCGNLLEIRNSRVPPLSNVLFLFCSVPFL